MCNTGTELTGRKQIHTSLIQNAFSAGLIASSIYMIAESTITVPELTGCLWPSEDSSLDRVKLSNLISQLTELLCKQYDTGTT